MLLKIRRLIAIYIDIILIVFICDHATQLLFIFDNIYYCTFINATGIVVMFNLFLQKDCLFGYESIGKKLMHLKIYQNNEIITDKDLLKDRIYASFWTFPYYPFMILINNKSTGDKKYNTSVK